MTRLLCTSTALVLLLSGPALAQTGTDDTPAIEVPNAPTDPQPQDVPDDLQSDDDGSDEGAMDDDAMSSSDDAMEDDDSAASQMDSTTEREPADARTERQQRREMRRADRRERRMERRERRRAAMERGGYGKRGMGGEGHHGMRGHHGGRAMMHGDGPENRSFEISVGRRRLVVDCGTESIADCVSGAQPLIEAMQMQLPRRGGPGGRMNRPDRSVPMDEGSANGVPAPSQTLPAPGAPMPEGSDGETTPPMPSRT